MITVRKLFSLKDGTRERKIVKTLADMERDLTVGILPDIRYLQDFLAALSREKILQSRDQSGSFTAQISDPVLLRHQLNRIRHEMIKALGTAPADWDLINPPDSSGGKRVTFPFRIYLDELRSPYNVGSIFRTAECMGVCEILLSPGAADPDHPRARRTSMGCTDRIPWRRMDYKSLELMDEPLFAMELGGRKLDDFSYPDKGILILGSEELGVSPQCISLAEKSRGVVTIPLYGEKASLNVSVAFGIVMNSWASRG